MRKDAFKNKSQKKMTGLDLNCGRIYRPRWRGRIKRLLRRRARRLMQDGVYALNIKNDEECFTPEPDNPYPLCIGRGKPKCEECCQYMHYEEKSGNGPNDKVDV